MCGRMLCVCVLILMTIPASSFCVWLAAGSCVAHPNSSSLVANDCAGAFVCQLPDGAFAFAGSEEECANMSAGCSARCVGESCVSYRFGTDGGACFVTANSKSECDAYSLLHDVTVEYSDGACVLTDVTDAGSCSQV